MTDPCPTCGHAPEPQPSDWLTPDELALVEFLTVRMAEHREALEEHTDGPLRELMITASDLVASTVPVVSGFAWTQDPARRAVLRTPLLLLAQPWAEHPDNQWMDELRSILTRG